MVVLIEHVYNFQAMVHDTTIVTIAFFMESSMSNPVEPKQVQQVAKLARIAISDETLAETAGQLNKILEYVQQLEAVKLPADVEPFFGAVESVNAIRVDENKPSTDRDIILQNAPDSNGEFYQVPPVFK